MQNDVVIDQEKVIKERLEIFLNHIHEIKDYHEKLFSSIEMYINFGNDDRIVMMLHQHLSELFNIDANMFFDYIIFDKYYCIDDLNMNSAVYRKALESVNYIKNKFGVILRNIIMRNRQPFLINAVEVNVDNYSSVHNLRIHRADGESFAGLFKTETLMVIVTNLIGSIQKSMEVGVFNLNSDLVKMYIDKSDELRKYLFETLEKNGMLEK